MPNLISVSGQGLSEAAGLDVGGAFGDAKNTYGEIRKAGAILQANPLGALLGDLIFPQPMADGTMDARSKL